MVAHKVEQESGWAEGRSTEKDEKDHQVYTAFSYKHTAGRALSTCSHQQVSQLLKNDYLVGRAVLFVFSCMANVLNSRYVTKYQKK